MKYESKSRSAILRLWMVALTEDTSADGAGWSTIHKSIWVQAIPVDGASISKFHQLGLEGSDSTCERRPVVMLIDTWLKVWTKTRTKVKVKRHMIRMLNLRGIEGQWNKKVDNNNNNIVLAPWIGFELRAHAPFSFKWLG